MQIAETYPLSWPLGYKRTERARRSRFMSSLIKARDYIKEEVRKVGGSDLIISTNLPTNANGELRANGQRFKVDDYGTAIYFTRNGQQVCLCCDEYDRVHDNLYAIGRTLEALRQIDRDGVSDFLNRTFSAFPALAQQTETLSAWDILGVPKGSTKEAITSAYRRKAAEVHPDKPGGSHEAMQALNIAYQLLLK